MMEKIQQGDFSLMSWNILAPCWVNKEWYPSMYQLANDHEKRMEKISSEISSRYCDDTRRFSSFIPNEIRREI